jgi:23S rRNA (uridine2552-2'-O)-methyltransferase
LGTYDRKDRFHRRAKREGFRSRAAYKLAEIDERHRLLRRGAKVVDLGCWPGGWLQVAAAAVGPAGRVVGVDVAPMDPLPDPQVVVLEADLAEPGLAARILAALGGPADLLLCDAAPKLTGVRDRDRALEEELLQTVEGLVPALLRPGGDLLVKVLESPEARSIERRLAARFERSKAIRPEASRRGSSERYLLARGLRRDVARAADPK